MHTQYKSDFGRYKFHKKMIGFAIFIVQLRLVMREKVAREGRSEGEFFKSQIKNSGSVFQRLHRLSCYIEQQYLHQSNFKLLRCILPTNDTVSSIVLLGGFI